LINTISSYHNKFFSFQKVVWACPWLFHL
jgi:hypothetical protein